MFVSERQIAVLDSLSEPNRNEAPKSALRFGLAGTGRVGISTVFLPDVCTHPFGIIESLDSGKYMEGLICLT